MSLSNFTRALLVVGAMLTCSVAWAEPVQIDIPAQDLGNALVVFSRQTNLQIVVSAETTRGMQAPKLSGRMEPDAALRALLGDAFRFEYSNPKTVVISRAPQRDSLRVAPLPRAVVSNEPPPEELTVTGSRLRRIDDGPAPIVAFDLQTIQQLGATNVADVLNYLPQRASTYNEQTNFGGSRVIQLRNLGVGTTLVLINGRRVVTSALQEARNSFDLNTIPLPAVERIEVLSDSASAVYGADAIGGVVNIILKRVVEAPFVDLYLGSATEGGGTERRASAGFGHSSENLRLSLMVDADKRDFIRGADRDILNNQDYRRFGGLDLRATTSNPGNIYSLSGGPLPGLTSTFAAVPAGSTGVGLTPASFLATQGTRNLDGTQRYVSAFPKSFRNSIVGTVEYDVADKVTLFTEFLATRAQQSRLLGPGSLSNGSAGVFRVAANNPYNPFGVPVGVDYLFTSLPSRNDHSGSDFFRGVVGAKGEFRGWNWEVATLGLREIGQDQISNQLDTAKVNAALASTNPATALNPFGSGAPGSQDLLNSLLLNAATNTYFAQALQETVQVTGSLFSLPGGDVQLAAGGEGRTEKFDFKAKTSNLRIAGNRTSAAGFVELLTPIVGANMDVPLAKLIAFTFAGRYDHYSDFGGTFNPEYGLQWKPYADLMLRASYGTSFRPPSLFELNLPQTRTVNAALQDPARGGAVGIGDLITGGNAHLNPEQGKSTTYGFIYQPNFIPNLRFTFNRWRVQQDQRVQTLTNIQILSAPTLFADRILRAAPTAADIAAGLPGRILSVDATTTNLGSVDTKGVDLKLDYRFSTPIGMFEPGLSATYTESFLAATLPGTPVVQRVGRANFIDGSIPHWRAVGSLGWSLKGAQLYTAVRYNNAYLDASQLGVATNTRVPSQTIVDLQASYRFGETGALSTPWLDGTTVRLGAINLFNHLPDYAQVGGLNGYDVTMGDLRGRYLYMRSC